MICTLRVKNPVPYIDDMFKGEELLQSSPSPVHVLVTAM